MSISECSSGCESGWTRYLDHSDNHGYYPSDDYYRIENVGVNYDQENQENQEDEEDLSMVSDASSGPRHFHEDEHNGYFSLPTNKNKNKNKNKMNTMGSVGVKEHRGIIHQNSSYLDDTASSPVFNFSKNNVLVMSNDQAPQPGFSTNHLKGKAALQKHFGFSNPSSGGASGKSGGLKKGRKQ